MKWWKQKRRGDALPVVQVRQGERHPFGVQFEWYRGYIALGYEPVSKNFL